RKLKEKLAKSNNKIVLPTPPEPSPETPPEDTAVLETPEEKFAEEVWADVYRHDLLNQKVNYVQVKNASGEIVYRTENVDTLAYPPTAEGLRLFEIPYEGKHLRVAALKAPDMEIAVGYP